MIRLLSNIIKIIKFMEIAYILIAVGMFNIVIASMAIFRKGFAENYVATSPKAYLFRRFFGQEKSVKLVKSFFAPLGFFIGLGMLIFGIVVLIR